MEMEDVPQQADHFGVRGGRGVCAKDHHSGSQIPITKPFFGSEELEAVQKPLETGWVTQGPYVKEFEERFSDFTGSPYSVATSSCTSALHIAVASLGLAPGDEVIVPAFTWISTANVVEFMGAQPVFCDIELGTFNLDVTQIPGRISRRTVGIIPVHLFGLCADMNPIMELARKHGLWVVEDAACAFGAWYFGRHAGLFGEAGCFSFHPRKAISTGEGGMITTADSELDRLSRMLRDHGASRSDLTRHEGKASFLLSEYRHLGYNYRMTDIQAALGCAQMGRAAWILTERAKRAQRYDEMLSGLEWLQCPRTPEGFVHGYQAYVCLFLAREPALERVEQRYQARNALMVRLESSGIATRQGTHAPILLEYYASKYALRPEQYPNAYLADRLSLALPLFPQMSGEEQDRVACELKQAFEKVS